MAFGPYGEGFPPYVPVAERRAQAAQRLAEMSRRGEPVNPVEIKGRAIATTFWGKAWCQNLESYSDYANRLPRGRSYARNGSVVDLRIEPGRLRALVSGSSLYTAEVAIRPLKANRWTRLVTECAGKIESVVELLSGRLSEGVMEILCGSERGLFPSTGEIDLSCSCPDGARLCKHLAAVLYGVGARLDHQPELLFVLRGVDQMDLVSQATDLGEGLGRAASGGLEGESLSELFGIEIEMGPAAVAPRVKEANRRPKEKKPARERPVKPVITRQELRARGVPAKEVQRWLRLGILLYTRQRGAYLKTRETEKRIAALRSR